MTCQPCFRPVAATRHLPTRGSRRSELAISTPNLLMHAGRGKGTGRLRKCILCILASFEMQVLHHLPVKTAAKDIVPVPETPGGEAVPEEPGSSETIPTMFEAQGTGAYIDLRGATIFGYDEFARRGACYPGIRKDQQRRPVDRSDRAGQLE